MTSALQPIVALEAPRVTPIDALQAERAAAREAALAGRGGVALARQLSGAFDAFFAATFDASACAGASLLAVGGYGRGTLAPGSDLDLVLLVSDPESPAAAALAESLLHPLWNARVSVGHAVRSVDDFVSLARADLRTATTVLDARCVAGDAEHAGEATTRCARAVFEGDLARFFDGLVDEMTARHRRYGATVYLLEPDVKHSRGGMRDLDIARWALRARYRVAGFDEALRVGALTATEHAALAEAEEFLWRVRAVLHARAARRLDRLSFDEQEEIATRLGEIDAARMRDDAVTAVGEAVERVMSTWYRHARAVSTAAEHLIARSRAPRLAHDHAPRVERITDEVVRFDGALCFAHADATQRDPSLALRIIELAVARGHPIASGTRAALAAAAHDPAWCASLRVRSTAAMAFRRILTTSARARLRVDAATPMSGTETNEDSVLAELHDLGLMLAMIPEFGHVTGRVQNDIYHVYTVDVHSVAAVDRLHALSRAELGDAFPLATRIAGEIDRLELVCLATLLHDIGKSRGGSHARIGAEMVPAIAARLGFGPDDADAVAWLVREHLTLYHAATRRDLGDPSTLAALVETVRDPWRLQALLLLTVADVSTTSPSAMTSWKARVLDELYLRVDEAFGSRGAPDHDRAARLVAQAIARAPASDRGAVERLVARMPERYVTATAPEAIARHARALDGVAPGGRLAHLALLDGDLSGELLEVLLVAPDAPGLLSRFAALLYANRLDVQSAQVHSSMGDAVDVFVVRAAHVDAVERARIAARLARQLDALLDDDGDPDALVAATRASTGLARPEPAVRSAVEIHDDASDAATVVEVYGRDRPGFLYQVTRALHRRGAAITLARINTEGRRAADTFYVTDADGQKLAHERFDALRAALLDVLDG